MTDDELRAWAEDGGYVVSQDVARSVLRLLDAVASFQQDDYTMTAAEAGALAGAAKKNRPRVRAKSLPTRPHSSNPGE